MVFPGLITATVFPAALCKVTLVIGAVAPTFLPSKLKAPGAKARGAFFFTEEKEPSQVESSLKPSGIEIHNQGQNTPAPVESTE